MGATSGLPPVAHLGLLLRGLLAPCESQCGEECWAEALVGADDVSDDEEPREALLKLSFVGRLDPPHVTASGRMNRRGV